MPNKISAGFHRGRGDETHNPTGNVLEILLPGEGTATHSRQLHILQAGDNDRDWNIAAQANPTLYIHSVTTPITDYLSIGGHDGTTAIIDIVGGTTISLRSVGLSIVQFIGVASAVNQLTLRNSITATPVIVEATGTDTNISLRLTAKGTGVIQTTQPLVEEMTQTAVTDTATLTIAQLLTKVIDGTPTAAATYTLPTAALLVAGIANAQVGDSFLFFVNNKSGGANTITIAAGGSGTADGTLTVAQNVIREFLIIVTNVTAAAEAYFVYGMG